MNKKLLFILIPIFLILITLGGYFYSKNLTKKPLKNVPISTPTLTTKPVLKPIQNAATTSTTIKPLSGSHAGVGGGGSGK